MVIKVANGESRLRGTARAVLVCPYTGRIESILMGISRSGSNAIAQASGAKWALVVSGRGREATSPLSSKRVPSTAHKQAGTGER